MSISVCWLVGYPVGNCSSPLAVVAVMVVVLAAVIVELVVVGISSLAK
jgi:hypothetical protein